MNIRSTQEPEPQLAFGRVELLAVLAMLAFLATVVLPAWANTRPRSDRVICANNLRQIGMAMQVWGNDFGDRPPYDVPYAEGGTLAHPLAPNAWLHFSWVSNELATPKVLFCPSDDGQPASDFSGDPKRGYLHPNLRNTATSYFITHYRGWLLSLQMGDRNVTIDGSSGCYRFNSAPFIQVRPARPSAGWTNGLHEWNGNCLFLDGQVEQADNWRFREILDAGEASGGAGGGSMHLALPR
jgi:type II secretory pathway pseudopilin PulG